MKPKKIEKTLKLSKRTVANLSQTELLSAKAGAGETENPSGRTCIWSDNCLTFCLGNCLTYEFPTCPGGTDTCP